MPMQPLATLPPKRPATDLSPLLSALMMMQQARQRKQEFGAQQQLAERQVTLQEGKFEQKKTQDAIDTAIKHIMTLPAELRVYGWQQLAGAPKTQQLWGKDTLDNLAKRAEELGLKGPKPGSAEWKAGLQMGEAERLQRLPGQPIPTEQLAPGVAPAAGLAQALTTPAMGMPGVGGRLMQGLQPELFRPPISESESLQMTGLLPYRPEQKEAQAGRTSLATALGTRAAGATPISEPRIDVIWKGGKRTETKVYPTGESQDIRTQEYDPMDIQKINRQKHKDMQSEVVRFASNYGRVDPITKEIEGLTEEGVRAEATRNFAPLVKGIAKKYDINEGEVWRVFFVMIGQGAMGIAGGMGRDTPEQIEEGFGLMRALRRAGGVSPRQPSGTPALAPPSARRALTGDGISYDALFKELTP